MAKQNRCTNEVREIIIKLVINEGKSQAEASRTLGVPASTISYIVKKYYEIGTEKIQKTGGAKRLLLTDTIKQNLMAIVNDNSTVTISGMIRALQIDVHPSTIWRWLKKINISFKMVRSIPRMRNNPAVKIERQAYVEWYRSMPINIRYNKLIFVDESPFNLHMLRSHGWSMRGETPNPILGNARGRNVTMILAVSCTNVVFCEAVYANVDGNIFRQFLRSIHRVLGDGNYTIVMDNVKFHRSDPDFFDDFPYAVRYLPRYSPFLNPCEEVFSQMKSNVRRDGPLLGIDDMTERMTTASRAITTSNLEGYFDHCEQFFQACTLSQDIPRN